jgi:hypothetical protein
VIDAVKRLPEARCTSTKVKDCVKIAVFIWDYILWGIPGSIKGFFTLRTESDNACYLHLSFSREAGKGLGVW